ncbi:VOC family protein [Paenibacillus lutrae]|uniref:VOC family protein n=1 Tax=Paenibacillus lutrae TaxID=2078573 RepID=UPI00191272C0
MRVKRIVTTINTQNVQAAKSFYQDVLELDLLMDHGWIETYGLLGEENVQISFAAQGGSNKPTPDLSIEVDDIDAVFERLEGCEQAGISIWESGRF